MVELSVRLSVGLTAESSAAALRAGIRRVNEHPYLLDGVGDPLRCARDPGLPTAPRAAERIRLMLENSLEQLSSSFVKMASGAVRGALLLVLPEKRPGFDADDEHELVRTIARCAWLEQSKATLTLVTPGHAGGFSALMKAKEWLSERRFDLCSVVGVDSYIDAEAVLWLEQGRRLARRDIRGGLIPGEGAAAVTFASLATCRRFGMKSLGRVKEAAASLEKRQLASREGTLGEGLSLAIQAAARSQQPAQITDVYSDINGERHRAEEWGFALLRCGQPFQDGTRYFTHATGCGDVGAATAPLQWALAARAWQRSYARGSLAMSFAGSWGGLRGAALLERAQT